VRPPEAATFRAADNVIVGNTVLYGATSGRAFFAGRAGERFAVRNSGALAVVEGAGDHACEYMTGGVVVVLGRTGRNFGAGMSGGVAYVVDEDDTFASRCNMGMIEIEPLVDSEDERTVWQLVSEHLERTRSVLAAELLSDWPRAVRSIKKVIPTEYKKVLLAERAAPPAAAGSQRHLVLVK
jgi:glutamate synthase domain-containing protein 3